MVVTFLNEQTGEDRDVEIGLSWKFFAFSFFYGMPLFSYKLYVQGAIMFICGLAYTLICFFPSHDYELFKTITYLYFFFVLAASSYFCITGSKSAALNYIRLGYKIIQTDKFTKERIMHAWGIPETAFIEN